jgi:XTP/dITP diphosphohydrolase
MKKISHLLIGSNNKGKLREIKALLPKRMKIYSTSDFYKELDKKDKNCKSKKIKARFICSLSISYLDKIIACVRGKIEGTISTEPKGNNGFGYDPIFIPNKKKLTFGEMSSKVKYKMDHRFNAFKKIKKFL